METKTYSAFSDSRLIGSGELVVALRDVKAFLDSGVAPKVLIFDDETGEQVDFDFRGTMDEVLERALPHKSQSGPGRPALGIVCREIALLPRHWEWLESQQGNSSATLRRLVDDAIRNEPASVRARRALESTDRELWVLAGNLPGCEETSRALYARDFERFESLMEGWPRDIANHLAALAKRAS